MKLTVKNFGPIREARDIDISQMTIFVGPSNTGKSYLAMLIYSIFKVFADMEYAWEISHRIRREDEDYSTAFDNLRQSRSTASSEIETCFFQWTQATSDVWKNQVVYCFGEEGRNVIEGKNGNEGVSVTVSDSEEQLVVNLTSPENSKTTRQKREQLADYLNQVFSDMIREYSGGATITEPDEKELYGMVLRHHYSLVMLQLFQSALLSREPGVTFAESFYLPAIRGGIMQSHRTLVSTLIERAPMAGLSDSPPIPLFNGVLSDFMKKLINIDSGESGRTRLGSLLKMTPLFRHTLPTGNDAEQEKIEKFGRSIEKNILSGEIAIQKSEARYPDFRYKFKMDGKLYDLPLMSASSSVSELAPVSLFIRHYVCPGDLFIVEEPEAHLHPAAQRDISDVLARLVNAGVKVLVTTHSDNILEQVSNFIYAADIPDSKLTKLDEEKCSVYLFKPGRGRNKTTVKKIPFDPETGLVTQDHLDVSSALYNETVNLMEKRDNAGSQTDI